MIFAVLGLIVAAIIFLPGQWVKFVMARHSGERPDIAGTGGELAEHLLQAADLAHVTVETTEQGDHYDPEDKAVRLSEANFTGRSLTAVAIAAHEVSHALQDAHGYAPLKARTGMAGTVHTIQRIGSVVLMATPLVGILTRVPHIMALEVLVGLALIGSSVVMHAVTLPVEFDASFKRALPILDKGNYIDKDDLPAAREVLRAAALTYVAAALMDLLNIARWLRILRF
ncbi:MAG: zinc metallopeptidase [Pseudomonadota bacterium]